MKMKYQYAGVLAFCAILIIVSIPVKAGRTGNGSSDYMYASMNAGTGIFPTNIGTQAQGTIFINANVLSIPGTVSSGPPFPCGASCGELVNVIAGHYASTNGCLTVTGACLDIFVCCGNKVAVDITTPNSGEALTIWTTSTGPHKWVFQPNRTAANMALYDSVALQTISSAGGGSPGSDPGQINYSAGGTCTGDPCALTVLAAAGGPGTVIGSFANATISDLAFWNVTLNAGEIKSLANCVPPNRIEPEHVSYYPLYGVDSPEPNYNPLHFGSPAVLSPLPLTLHGTTKTLQQVGCQPGGAYR